MVAEGVKRDAIRVKLIQEVGGVRDEGRSCPSCGSTNVMRQASQGRCRDCFHLGPWESFPLAEETKC